MEGRRVSNSPLPWNGRLPLMHLVRWSASLFGTIAVLAALFAGATIWLLLTDPVTVAESVNRGEVSPLVSQLATVLYSALKGLLKYL
jgi:hypothetical protein